MRIAVLTSSRADYGIYLPLLKAFTADSNFELSIIAFGTHLSHFHGYTLDQIKADGFENIETIESLILGDSETAISNAIGNTIINFSSFWKQHKNRIDLVFALGDRYEMFAAVAASVPFNIPIAHIHGGETTLGAIDNKFRHTITIMAEYHFTSTKMYADRVIKLGAKKNHVFNVGALSLDNLQNLRLLTIDEFKDKWHIDLSKSTILTTFHPETVSVERNYQYAQELSNALQQLSKTYQIVVTMPNADTMGMIIRKELDQLISRNSSIIGIENFGTLGYFSCIKHCTFLLGNTSSGIIEAASFGKYVINLGDRQKGRTQSENTIDVPVNKEAILNAVAAISKEEYQGKNVYQHKIKSSKLILEKLYSLFKIEKS